MSRNVSGVYTLPPGSAAVDNTIIDPVVYNALLSDLEADLNLPRPIVAGGTGAASADGALTALGGTTTGKALFTALSVAEAAGALGLVGAEVPPGQVGFFFRVTAPPTWLIANGANVSRATYAGLWAAMGSPNSGDGATTFTLPDMRGVVPRGLDSGRGFDSGRTLGTYQADQFQDHGHTAAADNHNGHNHMVNMSVGSVGQGNALMVATAAAFEPATGRATTVTGGAHTHAIAVSNANSGTRGAETRVKNVALLACIKT